MADTKPGVLARFVTEKSVYAVRGFCATMNWLISCVSSLSAGRGITIVGIQSGTPKISANIKAGPGVRVTGEADNDALTLATNISAGDGVSVSEQGDGSVKVAANLVAGDNVEIVPESGAMKIKAKGSGIQINDHNGISRVYFSSADDSNVVFTVNNNIAGIARISVGVYWS